jgi:ATP-dependent exoDNAse (exonuclease V) beta subunit
LDVISYLKAILNFYDSSSLYRVLRMLPMDLNAEEVARITQSSDKKGIPVLKQSKNKYLMTKLQTETRVKWEKLVQSLKKHFEISNKINTSEIFINLLSDLGYEKKLSEHLAKRI